MFTREEVYVFFPKNRASRACRRLVDGLSSGGDALSFWMGFMGRGALEPYPTPRYKYLIDRALCSWPETLWRVTAGPRFALDVT